MTTRSTTLGFWISTGTRVFHTLFAVPTGHVAIVKSAQMANLGSNPAVGQVSLSDPATTTAGILLRKDMVSLEVDEWQGWAVIEAGQELLAFSDAPGVHFWSSGAVLLLDS